MSGASEKLFLTKYPYYYVSESGKVFREDRHRGMGIVEVKPFRRGGNPINGYYMSVNISLYSESGKTLKQTREYVHRLVAETLIPNPQCLEEVNHIDEDKSNNCISNLQWISHRDNLEYSGVNIGQYNYPGMPPTGQRHGIHKKTQP